MSSLLISSMAGCDLLIATGFYLTDSLTLDHVCWTVDGRKTVLFEMPKDSSTDFKMEPAVLSAIVILSEQGYFLTSDGNWCGPSEITPHLFDAKGSCIGMAPHVNPFCDDLSSLLEHTRHCKDKQHHMKRLLLLALCATTVSNSSTSSFRYTTFLCIGSLMLNFLKCTSTDGDDGNDSTHFLDHIFSFC